MSISNKNWDIINYLISDAKNKKDVSEIVVNIYISIFDFSVTVYSVK